MFKNVGKKIRNVAIAFFVILCIASFALLVIGIVAGIMLEWAWPVVYGVIGASVVFVISLVSTYMLYGYGTLIKSCEENTRINAEILAFLRSQKFNFPNPVQATPEKAPKAEKPTDEHEDVKLYGEDLNPVLNQEKSEEIEEPAVNEVCETVIESAEAEEVEKTEEPEAVEEHAEEAIPANDSNTGNEPFADDLFSDFTQNSLGDFTEQPSEPRIKRCPSCGNAVRARANFCNQCGYKMK